MEGDRWVDWRRQQSTELERRDSERASNRQRRRRPIVKAHTAETHLEAEPLDHGDGCRVRLRYIHLHLLARNARHQAPRDAFGDFSALSKERPDFEADAAGSRNTVADELANFAG